MTSNKRYVFTLPDATADTLRRVAHADGVSMSDVVRRAIRLEAYFHDVQARGERVLIQNPDTKQVRELLAR